MPKLSVDGYMCASECCRYVRFDLNQKFPIKSWWFKRVFLGIHFFVCAFGDGLLFQTLACFHSQCVGSNWSSLGIAFKTEQVLRAGIKSLGGGSRVCVFNSLIRFRKLTSSRTLALIPSTSWTRKLTSLLFPSDESFQHHTAHFFNTDTQWMLDTFCPVTNQPAHWACRNVCFF